MIQQELDKFEKLVLTDLFGGYTSDYLVIGKGFMSYNISSYVQNYIKKFETVAKKYMDLEGNLIIPQLNIKAKPSDIYMILKGKVNDIGRTSSNTQSPLSWFDDND